MQPLQLIRADSWTGNSSPIRPFAPTRLAENWRTSPAEGTLTFLFTDIEGSTRLWEEYPEAMRRALARHDAILRNAIQAHGGMIFKTGGDAFFAAFRTAPAAVASAWEAQQRLAKERWGTASPLRVRMAVHTGTAEFREGDFFGPPLNRIARILATGHGGQVLLSAATRELVQDALPDGAGLEDLGEHRLRDLHQPERIFQLLIPSLPNRFPPLNTLSTRRPTLPAATTALIGREPEIAIALDMLRRADVRLLTLTGPGGVGKTRLALEVASRLSDDFTDGTLFVPLAAISATSTPDCGGMEMVALSAIAQALDLPNTGEQNLPTRLERYLGQKRMLVLLDNFEQILVVAPYLVRLLATCPQVKLLVTSRSVLRISGERELPVPPLPLPASHLDPQSLTQVASVALFVERAQAVKPDFQLTPANCPAVAEICARLDGLPLAIELAAARIKILSPAAILDRIMGNSGPGSLKLLVGGARDLPARQQTLRHTIDWGHHLLTPAERVLFRRLGVFAGGFSLAAAAAVLTDEDQPAGWAAEDIELLTLEGLTSLVDKSLVRQTDGPGGQPRFGLLETIREYSLEQLATSGEMSQIRRQHACFYLALAEAAEPHLTTAGRGPWLEALEREQGNLLAALKWGLEVRPDPETIGSPEPFEIGARLAAALWWLWYYRGSYHLGRTWLGTVLERGMETARLHPDRTHARLLLGNGTLALIQHDSSIAYAHLQASTDLWCKLDEPGGLAYAYFFLARAAVEQGSYSRTRPLLEESLALFRQIEDRSGTALALFELGKRAKYAGEESGIGWLHESLSLARSVGDKWVMAQTLRSLAMFAVHDTNAQAGRAQLTECLAIWQELGDKYGLANALNDLGELARNDGDDIQAEAYYQQSLALWRELGIQPAVEMVRYNLAHLACHQGDSVQARLIFQEHLRWAVEHKQSSEIALALIGLAGVASAEHQPERAACLLGAVRSLLTNGNISLVIADRQEMERTLTEIRAQLDEARFATAWKRGQTMTVEEAVEVADEL